MKKTVWAVPSVGGKSKNYIKNIVKLYSTQSSITPHTHIAYNFISESLYEQLCIYIKNFNVLREGNDPLKTIKILFLKVTIFFKYCR